MIHHAQKRSRHRPQAADLRITFQHEGTEKPWSRITSAVRGSIHMVGFRNLLQNFSLSELSSQFRVADIDRIYPAITYPSGYTKLVKNYTQPFSKIQSDMPSQSGGNNVILVSYLPNRSIHVT